VQASQGFAAPRHSSEIIVRTSHNGLDFVTAVVACDGNWVLAQWRQNAFRRYRYEPPRRRSDKTFGASGLGDRNLQHPGDEL
jgi:hypothetical protein